MPEVRPGGFVPTQQKRNSERARQVKLDFLLLTVSAVCLQCAPGSHTRKGGRDVFYSRSMVFTSNEKTAPAWANKTIFQMSARVWTVQQKPSLDKRVSFWWSVMKPRQALVSSIRSHTIGATPQKTSAAKTDSGSIIIINHHWCCNQWMSNQPIMDMTLFGQWDFLKRLVLTRLLILIIIRNQFIDSLIITISTGCFFTLGLP